MCAAIDVSLADQCEEPLDQTDRRRGRGDEVDLLLLRHVCTDGVEEAQEFRAATSSLQLSEHLAGRRVQSSEQRSRAVALVIVRECVRVAGLTEVSGKPGWVRLSAWIWLFSSTQSTSARSGGARYRPTMPRTLATKCGSLDSLNVFCRCGLSPKARQTRLIAAGYSPVALAVSVVLQWVAFSGTSCKVLRITF